MKNVSLTLPRRQHDGAEVPAEKIPSLHLEVHDREYVPRERDDEFPQYGAVTKWTVPVISLRT